MRLAQINFMILTLTTLAALQSRASFDENSRRYMTGNEIIQSLNVYFDFRYADDNCKEINDNNSALLGLNSPASGSPISSAPTQATVQWIAKCVSTAMMSFITGSTPEESRQKLSDLIGSDVYSFLKKRKDYYDHESNVLYNLNNPWANLPEDIQDKIISNMVDTLLGGDETIADFGIIEPNQLRAKLKQWPQKNLQITVFQMMQFIAVNLAVSDEFLSY